jgi:hypothetical protein
LPHFGVNVKTTSNSTDFLCLKICAKGTWKEGGIEDGTPLSGQHTSFSNFPKNFSQSSKRTRGKSIQNHHGKDLFIESFL